MPDTCTNRLEGGSLESIFPGLRYRTNPSNIFPSLTTAQSRLMVLVTSNPSACAK
jgi:hypothetical protein